MIRLKKLSHFTQLEKIKLFTGLGILLTVLLGSINHFVYNWTGKNAFVGIFVATNESIWEHIKLALFPMFIIFLVGGFLFYHKVNNYFLAVLCALTVTTLSIILIFMGYTLFTRRAILPIDIANFIFSIALGYYTAYRIFFMPRHKWLNYLSIVGILVFLGMFLTCTYHAPNIFLFQEIYVK
ncbi:MAG: hypothetical protein HFE34_03750 [Clostridia bacterium]|nr:hypothetical protein [Clostridia bacterium]